MTVVTVGTFDGVHPGHRAVIEEISERAGAAGTQSALVTFEPHPLEIVNPPAAPMRLTPDAERLEVLATTPVDRVVVLRFDRALAALSPEAFVREVPRARLGMTALVIGHDHGFGRGRSGDEATLRALGQELGFPVEVVPPVDAGDGHVSSSRIRRAVAGGDLDTAAALLGRRYSVSGVVEQGAGRGRQLGVPTINVGQISSRKLLPPDGVYAVVVETRHGRFGGMMNQGGRPTFGDATRTLEAHLFAFAGDLYGERVRLTWMARLRDVRRFDSAAALAAQLAQDRADARAALARTQQELQRVAARASERPCSIRYAIA
jgi:riboflavin kinase/FMN adenylyltransferase